MAIRPKTYTFQNRKVLIKQPKSTGDVIKYDIDNRFPQNLISDIYESGTAASCIESLNQYAFAEGYVNDVLNDLMQNDNQTFKSVLADIVQQAVIFQGIALHISRDTRGNIVASKAIPFENIRRAESYLVYNSTWNDLKYDSTQDVKFPYYAGVKVSSDKLAEIASYINSEGEPVGEILYHFKKRPGQYIYPVPTFYSGISDINTDAENSKFEYESVNNSFLPSGILTLVGEVDDVVEDENGNTEQDDLESTLSAFTGNAKDSQGETGRQKLAVLHAKSKDEIPNYQAINNDGVFTAVEASTKRVAEKVARLFGVPPFLIGLGGNVGFATNIISDNITLFNNRVLKIQQFIEETLNLVYPETDFSITQLKPINYVDPSMLAIIKDTSISPDQKENILRIVFRLSIEDSKKLSNGDI